MGVCVGCLNTAFTSLCNVCSSPAVTGSSVKISSKLFPNQAQFMWTAPLNDPQLFIPECNWSNVKFGDVSSRCFLQLESSLLSEYRVLSQSLRIK